MTSIMRGSDAFPFWAELRAELSRIGIDPQQALLVESYENDGTEVGVIVAPEASVVSYRSSAKAWTWTDPSETSPRSEYADQVRVGGLAPSQDILTPRHPRLTRSCPVGRG